MKSKTKKLTMVFILTTIIFNSQILLQPKISNAQTATKRLCWDAYYSYLNTNVGDGYIVSSSTQKATYMNMVFRCAENYLNMVEEDSRYCREALEYANMILPNLATVLASQIIFKCANR